MKKFYKIISALMAVVVALTCSGVVSLAAAQPRATISAVKIIKCPTKTVFVQGTDWDYGYYDMPEGGGLGTFVSGGNKISFKHYGGYYSRYADRGMVDMNGLVVRVTYSDGSTADIAYKETVSGTKVTQNIYASPRGEYKEGESVVEVYFKSNTKAYDSYTINLVKETLKGDVNNDSKVNSIDALMVLQHVVGLIKLSNVAFANGDMNSDGTLTSMDALLILRKSVS